MLIRPHSRADADRIAEILAAGWKQAYSHFMPPSFLAPRVDPAYRKTEIAEWLDDEFDPANEAIFVADDGHGVLGFIAMELGDKGDLGATGIVNLLYIDPAAQRRGIGRALLSAGAAWQNERRPGPLVLSAYADNSHRHAYEAMGGREAKRLRPRINDREIETVLYLWPDPKVLISG